MLKIKCKRNMIKVTLNTIKYLQIQIGLQVTRRDESIVFTKYKIIT